MTTVQQDTGGGCLPVVVIGKHDKVTLLLLVSVPDAVAHVPILWFHDGLIVACNHESQVA